MNHKCAFVVADHKGTRSAGWKLSALALFVVIGLPIALAQAGGGGNPELQQKLMALKQSAAENKQMLHRYQWIETSQVTLKGEQKPEKVYQCSYGANGQVQKIQLGAQADDSQQQQNGRRGGGRLKQKLVEKKTAEMKDYMQEVQSLLALYVPPNSQLMQQAFEKKNVSMEKPMGSDAAQLVFANYAKQGDQMTIAFDTATRKVKTINVSTYMDNPKDAVTLAIHMSSLADGTNYAQQTVLNATAKQLQVTTTNSNYARLQ